MSLLWCEGFDHIDDGNFRIKYDVAPSHLIQSNDGYNGTKGLTSTQGSYPSAFLLKRVQPATPTQGVAGYRIYTESLPYGVFVETVEFAVWSGSAKQLSINVDPTTGVLIVRRGDPYAGTLLGSTPTAGVVNSEMPLLQIAWTIDSTNGSVEIRRGSTVLLLLQGVNTQGATTGTWDGVELIPGPVETHDDFFILDRAGSFNNFFLAPGTHVKTLRPTGVGDVTQWTPSTGSNFQNVDDTTPDGGATQNHAQFSSLVDLYDMTELTDATTVYGVQANLVARKASASVASRIHARTRVDGLDYDLAEQAVQDVAFMDHVDRWEVNPATGALWTQAEINASHFGPRRAA